MYTTNLNKKFGKDLKNKAVKVKITKLCASTMDVRKISKVTQCWLLEAKF